MKSAHMDNTNLFWVLEQTPGYVTSQDMSSKILTQDGYWPSYNIPYFKEIFDRMGYPQMVAQFGDLYSYEKAPRAQIFRRDYSKVGDIKGMQHIMQYNDYKYDPLSKGDPTNAISARYDLLPSNNTDFSPSGGVDSKITSYSLAQTLTSIAISGPTHESLVPFSWKFNPWNYPHYGQPTTFDFDWELMSFTKPV